MNFTIGSGKTVHQNDGWGEPSTRCGAELAKGSQLHAVDAEVTCKRCLSLYGIAHGARRRPAAAPAPVVIAAPVITAPVVADKPKMFVRMCVCCQERHRAASREELSQSLKDCWKKR